MGNFFCLIISCMVVKCREIDYTEIIVFTGITGLGLVRHLFHSYVLPYAVGALAHKRCVQIGILGGSLSQRLCMQSGRSSVAFFSFFFSPLESRASIRVSWHRRRSHSRSTLSPSIMPISPPTLYLNVLRAPMVGSAGPAWGSECGECECRRTRHCSERGGEGSAAGTVGPQTMIGL